MGIKVSSHIFVQLHACLMWRSSLSYNSGKRWVFPTHVNDRGRRKLVESGYVICFLQSLPDYKMSAFYSVTFLLSHIQQGDRGRVVGEKATHFFYPRDSIHCPLWRRAEAFDMTEMKTLWTSTHRCLNYILKLLQSTDHGSRKLMVHTIENWGVQDADAGWPCLGQLLGSKRTLHILKPHFPL